MNLPVWNYLKASFLVVIQASLMTILANPWLQLAQTNWDFPLSLGIFWVFSTTILSIVVIKKMAGLGKRGLILLALGFGLPSLLTLPWRLPVVVFLPLNIVVFYLATRFNDYPKRRSFALDWAFGSLLLVVTSMLESKLGYHLSLLPMLAFFGLGMVALILWNVKSLETEGLAPDYSGLSGSITLFVTVVGTLSLLLGVFLSPAFLEAVLKILGKIYGVFADGVLFFIVRPFAWLMSPLFRWAENLEKQEITMDVPEMERIPLDRSELEQALNPSTVKALGWGGWVLFTVLFALILWLVVRKLINRPKESTHKVVKESRESIFSGAEVLRDLRGALQTLVKPLTKLGKSRWYRGQDPLMIIRTYYARFVVRANKTAPFEASTTPLEYKAIVTYKHAEINHEALSDLTEYYNEARYGERGDEEAVQGTEKAFQAIIRDV